VNLLTPLTGLILAVAVIPPLLLLYFLKLRRRQQAISCTLLWKKSVEDLRANAPFQRLRKNILLLLQLIALAFLIFSVMQPQLQGGEVSGDRTILMIDNSMSMTATDVEDEADRLANAKQQARNWVESVYTGGLFSVSPGETMVIAFSDRAEIMTRFTSSKQQILSAIDAIQPTHGETNVAQAFQFARAYTTNPDPESPRPISAPADFHLFSDGRVFDLEDQVLRGESMTYHPIGSPAADNVALATLSVERPYDRPAAVEVFAALLNFNREAATCDLELAVNDTTLGIQEATVPAARVDESSGRLIPGRNNVVFTPFEQPRGAVISVINLREDDLSADNSVQQVVAPPKRLAVALVESKSFVIRTALSGLDLERLTLMSGSEFDILAATGGTDQFDVIVLDNYAPEQLPPNRYVSFGATPPVEGLNEFGEGQGLVILDSSDDNPLLRHVNFDDLAIDKYKKLAPADDVAILAEGSDGPAIVHVSRGGLQVVHVTFDILDSSLPFSRSIVTFLFNAVEYLGQLGTGITADGYYPGDTIAERLPATATDVELLLPTGETRPLSPVDPTTTAWGPLRLSGPYVLTWSVPSTSEPQSKPVAVNARSEREGNINAVEQVRIGQEVVEGEIGSGQRYIPLWPYAVGFCLAVLMLEWWMYHRKIIV